MTRTFTVCDPNEMESLILFLQEAISTGRHLILLNGELGAGKTQLVRAYVQHQLGQQADSPTFALVNTYGVGDRLIHHFDLYRLHNAAEVEDIGWWDYVDQGVPCFVEWPDKITELLPQERCIRVQIDVLSNLCRTFSFSY